MLPVPLSDRGKITGTTLTSLNAQYYNIQLRSSVTLSRGQNYWPDT